MISKKVRNNLTEKSHIRLDKFIVKTVNGLICNYIYQLIVELLTLFMNAKFGQNQQNFVHKSLAKIVNVYEY